MAVDDTAYAPRLAEFVRCVGESAPGGPPPLPSDFRADDSIFFSHLPMNPPPPTGLVNRSGSSVSSTSAVVEFLERFPGLAPRHVPRCPTLRLNRSPGVGRHHLLGADDPERGRRITECVFVDAIDNESSGELLIPATSGSNSDVNVVGNKALFAASARWPSTAR